jgi:Zn finger protein HypA/HybF involved in hydrogenase expression
VSVEPLNRMLEQELFALLRGASLECLVCGEFVLHRRGDLCCPECGMTLPRDQAASASGVQFDLQAG